MLPKEQRITALFEQNNAAFAHAAGVLDKVLGKTDYMVNNRFSVTDILVGFTLNWGKGAGLLGDFPNLENYLERLKERPHCTL